MAGAGGDEWVYVPSQQEEEAVEDAEAKKPAVFADIGTGTGNVTFTCTYVGEKKIKKPSKNPDDDGETAAATAKAEEKESNANAEDETASAQPPPDSVNKAAPSPSESKETEEELYWAFIAAYRRANKMSDEIAIQVASRDRAFQAYYAASDPFAPAEESEIDRAFDAYLAAHRRVAEMNDELQLQEKSRHTACRAYVAALQRAAAAAGEQGPSGLEIPYNDLYGSNDDDTYGGAETGSGPYGGSVLASLNPGSGSGYDNTSYNRYGFGFPSAYGAALGYGYSYAYTYPYVLGYRPAPVYQAPPPAFSANSLYTPPPVLPMWYSFPVPTPAHVSMGRPSADEPSTPAVAPTTTTTTVQPLEPFSMSDSIFS